MSSSTTENDYCDFVTVCFGSNKQINIPKIILFRRSKVFEQELNSKQEGAPLDITSRKADEKTMQVFIDWLDTGHLKTSDYDVVQLLSLAAKYKAETLFIMCVYKLTSKLCDQNVKQVFILAAKYNLEPLVNKCVRHLKETLCKRNFGNRFILSFEQENQALQESIIEYINNNDTWYQTLIRSSQWKRLNKVNKPKAQHILTKCLTNECVDKIISSINDQNFATYLMLAFNYQNEKLQKHFVECAKDMKELWWGKLWTSARWRNFSWKNPDTVDFILEQLTPVKIKDPKFVIDYARDKLKIGYSKEQTFIAFYYEFFGKLEYGNTSSIKRWYEHFNDVDKTKMVCEVDKFLFFYNLATCINQQFQMAQRYTDARSYPDYLCERMCLLSARYALSIQRKQYNVHKFLLCDTLNGENKELKFDDSFETKWNIRLVNLHSNYFLFIDSVGTDDSRIYCTSIHLMKLNVEEMECVVIDKKIVDTMYEKCVVDSKNRNNFIIHFKRSHNEHLFCKGNIDGFRLQLDDKMLDFNRYLNLYSRYMKLTDNIMYGISFVQEPRFLVKFTVETNKISAQRLHAVENPNTILNYTNVFYAWDNEICYILQKVDEKVQLLAYNMETNLMNEIKWFERMSDIYDVILEDGILIFCTWNKDSLQHLFYRVPLTQPDALFNLTIYNIQKQLIFADVETYETFVQNNVPQKLRPFGGSN